MKTTTRVASKPISVDNADNADNNTVQIQKIVRPSNEDDQRIGGTTNEDDEVETEFREVVLRNLFEHFQQTVEVYRKAQHCNVNIGRCESKVIDLTELAEEHHEQVNKRFDQQDARSKKLQQEVQDLRNKITSLQSSIISLPQQIQEKMQRWGPAASTVRVPDGPISSEETVFETFYPFVSRVAAKFARDNQVSADQITERSGKNNGIRKPDIQKYLQTRSRLQLVATNPTASSTEKGPCVGFTLKIQNGHVSRCIRTGESLIDGLWYCHLHAKQATFGQVVSEPSGETASSQRNNKRPRASSPTHRRNARKKKNDDQYLTDSSSESDGDNNNDENEDYSSADETESEIQASMDRNQQQSQPVVDVEVDDHPEISQEFSQQEEFPTTPGASSVVSSFGFSSPIRATQPSTQSELERDSFTEIETSRESVVV